MILNKIDLPLEKYLINRFISMPKLFDSLGIDYRINSNIYCPFHANDKSPAAHLYADEHGYRVWCFSENKMYGSWDVYKTYMPQINTNKLALMIFNRLNENDQKIILDSLNNEQEIESLPYNNDLIRFKRKEINITQLLQIIADSHIDEA